MEGKNTSILCVFLEMNGGILAVSIMQAIFYTN